MLTPSEIRTRGRRESRKKPEPFQISLGPVRLPFDHAPQRFRRKGIARPMKRHRHTPAIGVTVALVTADLGTQEKAVANQGGHDLPSGQTAELAVVNRHGLDRDGDQRLLGDLDVFGNRLTVLD
jgi:hypothetical protein